MSALELQQFASALQLGLGYLGVVSIDREGTVSLRVPPSGEKSSARTFTFLDSLEEIRRGITIDVASWRSMWPDRSREEASIALFSVHVQEAIAMADESATTLQLTPSGVWADH